MTSNGPKVPDAWEDDWESQKGPQSAEEILESMPKLSKAERRAKQAELNKRLWEEAEAPRANYYVDNRNNVPMQTEVKPAVKVLSRKPTSTVVAKKDLSSGMKNLAIEDDDDEDEGQSASKPLTAEERKRQAQRDREAKQRKYEEARERLFGAPTPGSGSGSNSPKHGAASPSRSSSERGKGRGRGGGRPTSSSGTKSRQPQDSHYNANPEPVHVHRHGLTRSHSPTKAESEHIIRQPHGPDGTGRGGTGFANRRGRRP